MLNGGDGSAQQFWGSFPGCRRVVAVSEHSVRELCCAVLLEEV